MLDTICIAHNRSAEADIFSIQRSKREEKQVISGIILALLVRDQKSLWDGLLTNICPVAQVCYRYFA